MSLAARIRPATPGDAVAIAAVERDASRAPTGATSRPGDKAAPAGGTTARRWARALALPAGDDHFVLAAVEEGGGLVGFASAGGSRDDDGKGDGELYALGSEPGPSARDVQAALVAAVLVRLADAGYARATRWLDGVDAAPGAPARAMLERLGFGADDPGEGRPGQRRFSRPLLAGSGRPTVDAPRHGRPGGP